MSDTLGEWTQLLGERPLPIMASSKRQVARLLDSSSTTNADLQRVISRDPGFALELFRHYAAAAGASKEPPGSLTHAVALLGQASISKLLRQLPVVEEVLEEPARQGLLHCYSHALHAAHYASAWGHEREDSNPEELGLAALLYSCGEMALRAHAGAKMEQIEAGVADGADYASSSRNVLGFTLQQLNHALAELWHLPHLVSSALSGGWPTLPRAQKVVLATLLARETARDWTSGETLDLIELLAEIQHLAPDRAGAALHTLAAETARDIQDLALPLSAPGLLGLRPTREQKPERKPDQKPIPAKKPPVTPASSERPTATEPAPANPLQKGLTLVTTRMRKELGVTRVMFAMLSRDRTAIKARFVTGAEKGSALSHFNCAIDKRNLFSVLLSKPQGFWLREDNREKYLPLIPAPLREAVDTRGFFIMSIYLRNKPIGLLYADAAQPEALNEEAYKRFKQLCRQFCNQLAGGK